MDPEPLDAVLDALPGARHVGGQRVARCPAHEDRRPSLSIRQLADGTVLLKCHAGCQTESVLEALGLTYADLYPSGR